MLWENKLKHLEKNEFVWLEQDHWYESSSRAQKPFKTGLCWDFAGEFLDMFRVHRLGFSTPHL